MAQRTHTVKKYSYYFDARSGRLGLLQLWSDTALIADVRFYPEGTTRPVTSYSPNLDSASIYLWTTASAGLVDMLRHEGPIYLHLNDDPVNGWALISSSIEPVGESEV